MAGVTAFFCGCNGGPDARRRRRGFAMPMLMVPMLMVLTGCSPAFDWREIPAPGAEYRVRLPGKPATMTRQIHLEGVPVEMTMQGARVGETSFTVAVVPLGQADGERLVTAMRNQMLRNIGAPEATPATSEAVELVDGDGRKLGKLQMQSVSADGVGRFAGMRLSARFVHWQGRALQAVIVGPPVPAAESDQFFESLRLVSR